MQAILQKLKQNLQNLYPDSFQDLVLFGSYARNEATEDSDMDVLLVLQKDIVNPFEELDKIRPLKLELELEYQMLIQILVVSAQQFAARKSPLFLNIKKDGIRV